MPIRESLKATLVILRMIKIEHTIFALPFAFLGAFLAARGVPGWHVTVWILIAMTSARCSAMAFNRLVDRKFDARNLRTENRALPKGLVLPSKVTVFVVLSSALFLFSAWMLNRLAFVLSPLALLTVLGYSYTKRFTSLSHLVLGLALSISPVGGWIAVRGEVSWAPFFIAGVVLFWVAGFDIIYACQDVDFDRESGLYSLPSRLGVARALRISAFFHVLMVTFLLAVIFLFELSFVSWIGFGLVAMALAYEHWLVAPGKLGRINTAFFQINSLISIVIFCFIGLDVCLFG